MTSKFINIFERNLVKAEKVVRIAQLATDKGSLSL